MTTFDDPLAGLKAVREAIAAIAESNRWMSNMINEQFPASKFSHTGLPTISVPTISVPEMSSLWTPAMRLSFDSLENFGKQIRDEFQRVMPDNLRHGLSLTQLMEVAEKHYVPVAWVCPSHVIDELSKSDSRLETNLILCNYREPITRACSATIQQVHNNWRVHAITAVKLLNNGEAAGAQALAASLIEGFLTECRRGGKIIPHTLDKQKYKKANDLPDLSDLAEFLTLRPLAQAYLKFDASRDLIPESFNRHATAHRPYDPLTLGEPSAITAVMLLCAVLRRWAPTDMA